MKISILLILNLLWLQSLQAEALKITVQNIEGSQGFLYLSVYDSKDTYDNNKNAIIALKHKAKKHQVTFEFYDLPSGNYAIKVFHDENNNGDLDVNMLGIPKESYGFSNDGGNFGPASYKDAVFSLKNQDKNHIKINLR
ncbi:MAG: DUF2141 domain-containing protein [Pseudomonadota bacterium]